MNSSVAIAAIAALITLPSVLASQQAGKPDAQSPASRPESGAQITVTRESSRDTNLAPAEHFTGTVRIEPLFAARAPSRTIGAKVTFQPGARTAWHTHPLGQVLIVTDGVGWVQQWGGPVQVIRKGDVVWIPAGVKHWHGATPTTSMTHIAILEQLPDGNSGNWMEPVNDEQYRLSQ
jgi:quercetin dioxygenase-like cupin family protein